MITSRFTQNNSNYGSLFDKKIFIVGGGSGIGAAIAKMAVARGAKVALAGRTLKKLQTVANNLGNRVLGLYSIDLANEIDIKKALSEYAPYDHIVTTAADLTFNSFITLTNEQINSMLCSKFWGPIYLARAANKYLVSQGSVLFFSGLAAYRQGPGSSIVGAVNMALESLTAALAIELKPKRFNVISPGVVDSGTWDGMNNEVKKEFFAQIASKLPIGRVGTVEDEAYAALSILENGFINGTVINVDGGGRIA